jgi:heptosyltransferase-2
MNSKPPAILVVGPSWVGDMVMAQSLFKVLKRKQPDVNIDVLAPTWSENLLKRMPEVRNPIPHSIKHGEFGWQERQSIGESLRFQHYQQAIVLTNSWKSALIPFWAKIPQRTGYRGEMRYGLLNDIRSLKQRQTVEQYVALGLSKGEVSQRLPYPRLSPKQANQVLQSLNLVLPEQPILALCPGAEFGSAKCWPLEYYATVAKHKIAEGWKVWIFGSEKDKPLGEEIQTLAGLNNCLNLCGKTSISEAVDLLALSSAAISNDSGLMHVVAALDKPLIALYGSSNPSKTPPLSGNARILSLGLKCSPCYQRTCPKQHLKCLRDIKPQWVLETLKAYEIEGLIKN